MDGSIRPHLERADPRNRVWAADFRFDSTIREYFGAHASKLVNRRTRLFDYARCHAASARSHCLPPQRFSRDSCEWMDESSDSWQPRVLSELRFTSAPSARPVSDGAVDSVDQVFLATVGYFRRCFACAGQSRCHILAVMDLVRPSESAQVAPASHLVVRAKMRSAATLFRIRLTRKRNARTLHASRA